jgi:hypothetical protein
MTDEWWASFATVAHAFALPALSRVQIPITVNLLFVGFSGDGGLGTSPIPFISFSSFPHFLCLIQKYSFFKLDKSDSSFALCVVCDCVIIVFVFYSGATISESDLQPWLEHLHAELQHSITATTTGTISDTAPAPVSTVFYRFNFHVHEVGPLIIFLDIQERRNWICLDIIPSHVYAMIAAKPSSG